MIQSLDTSAHLNRFRDRTVENLVLGGGFLLIAVGSPPFPASAVVCVSAVIAATLFAGVPLFLMMRAMAVPCFFITIGLLPFLVSVRYEPLSGLTVAFESDGVSSAIDILMRSLGACASLVLLGATTPISKQIGVFRKLRVPRVLLDLMVLTYRMVFLFDKVFTQMITAQNNRLGYRTLRIGFHSAASVVAGLLVRVLRRAQSMERGLAARGYDGALEVPCEVSRPDLRRLAFILSVHGLIVLTGPVSRMLLHG